MFDGSHVLRRAETILEGGPLPPEHAKHGPWCVWCAAAMAKGQLDDEHDTGVNFSELQSLTQEVESDWPLVQARIALGKWNACDPRTFTQEQALSILREAQTYLQADSIASSSAE